MEADFELLIDVLQHYPRDYKDFQAVPVPGQNATLYGRVIESVPQAYHHTARVDTIVEIDQPMGLHQLSDADASTASSHHAQSALEPGLEDGPEGFQLADVTAGSMQSHDKAERQRDYPELELQERQSSHAQATTSHAG